MRWRRPPFWNQGLPQLCQGLGVQDIVLGSFELRLGKMVGLGRIDHTHSEPSVVQGGRQGHPIATSRFHDDQDGSWLQSSAGQSLLQLFKALTGLGKGSGLTLSLLTWLKQSSREIKISNIHSN